MIRKGLPADARAIAQVHVRSWQAAYCELMPASDLASLAASLPQREAHWARALEAG
ncbi:hypothetical protein [Pseudomonas sp. NPDC007930]|uniref:hypothetical protein n=1 Tax=Pseudomonas sp. NPDC007930 TaxID=3364417 RepID=UPI0036EAD91B